MHAELPGYELKYCERCGGLWLRARGADALYCAGCARLMRELPPRGAAPSPRPAARPLKADRDLKGYAELTGGRCA